MDYTIHKHDAEEVLASWGPVVIRVLRGVETRAVDIDDACTLFEALLERYPAITCVAVVEHGTPIPSPEIRRYSAERFGSFGSRLVIGIVFLGLGFWASTSLAAAALVMRLVRQDIIVETSVEALTTKLALEFVGLDGEGLAATIEALRADHGLARVD